MKRVSIAFLFLFIAVSLSAQPNKYGTGLIFDDEAYQNTPMKATLVRGMYGGSLPSSASLKKYTPKPKTQGNYGTCVGWSTAYAALTIVDAIENGWTNQEKITQNTFSPGFIYSEIKNPSDYGCKFGAWINDAFEIMKTKGAVRLSDFDEDCPGNISADLYQNAAEHKISGYAKIFGLTDSDKYKIEATKKSLSENKPVVIGMNTPSSFNDAKDCWIPTESHTAQYGGHAMCVIGYNDNVHGGAFEFQNSWGNWWGNDGYMWVKYDDYAKFVKYAYELIGKIKTSPDDIAELSGEIAYLLDDGTAMQGDWQNGYYRMREAYKSGTRFRLFISNNQPAFVYAFGTDLTGKTYQIFPHNQYISPALNYKQNDVAIPDENHFIEMDNTIGKDFLCVLYSAEPLSIDEIRQSVEQQKYGSLHQKVKNAVGNTLFDFSDVNYFSDGKIGFSAKSKQKTVVALIVEIEHVR